LQQQSRRGQRRTPGARARDRGARDHPRRPGAGGPPRGGRGRAAGRGPPALRLMAGGAGYRWRIFDWSFDDQRLLLGRESLSADTEANGGVAGDPELFVADVGNTELTPLVLPRKAASKAPAPAPTALRSRAARFAPDGRGILLLATGESAAGAGAAGADFWQLRYLDPVGGDTHVLSSESERDVDLFDESPDGHYLAYTINDNGTGRLAPVRQQRKLDLNLGALPPGVISTLQFDPTGKRLALT